jgi:hypothetical protein
MSVLSMGQEAGVLIAVSGATVRPQTPAKCLSAYLQLTERACWK